MSKRDLLLSVGFAALAWTPAAAQDAGTQQGTEAVEQAAAGDEVGPDVVVTGTQIKGSSITAALPVTVVDQNQITAIGAVSGDELLRSIPQMGDVSFNSTYLPNSSNAARGDVGSINLRNLGVGNTLVLLNGRRMVNHPTSRADDNLVPVLTVNSNAIPVFGLERLEVLRDGAAAIYGSDAVAGVVNNVLRTDFTGVQLQGQVGWAEDTNMIETSLNLMTGIDLGGRGNISLFGSYEHRSMLRAADQAYTASADKRPLFANTSLNVNGTIAAGLDGRNAITPWGNFTTLNGTVIRTTVGNALVTNTSGQFHVQPISFGGCSLNIPGTVNCIDDGNYASTAADRNLRFDFPAALNTTVMPEVTRYNAFLNGHYDLTDGLTFFAEGGYYYAKSKSIQQSTGTLASGPLIVPASNYWNPFGPVTFAGGQVNPNRIPGTNAPVAGVPVTLSSYNFVDVGPNVVDVDNRQFRVLGGLRFNVLGFEWETAAMYSEATVTDTSDGISQTLLQRQLALSTPDAYNPFNGGNPNNTSGFDTAPSSQAAINAIKIKTTRRSKATLALADLKGSKADLLSLPGGDVGMAIGVEVRRETQFDDRDPRVDGTIQFTDAVNGAINPSDLIGTSPSPDTKGSRTVAAGYLELAVPLVSPEMNIPLIDRLELQLAVRGEHYSDVGSVAKPKIAGAWDIVPGLRLRGSYAQGFKAPNLEQINATLVTRSNTRTDFIRCEAGVRQPATLNGQPNPNYLAAFSSCSQGFATSAQRSGNPDLKPEESETWSVGAVLQPRFLEDSLGRMTFTVDYWNIKQTGIVGLFGEGNALINDYLLRVQGSSDPNVVRAAPTQADIDLFAGTGLTPAGRVLFVRDKYVNLLPQEVSGIDLGFNWQLPDFGAGRITLSANAAYLKKFFLQPSPPIQALLDARAAGTINAATNIADAGDLVRQNGKPKWKANGSLTWAFANFQIGAYTAYVGDVQDTSTTGINWLVEDQMTFNLYGQVEVGNKSQGKYRLRIGVRNLTDKDPPLTTNGYLGSLYNPYARYWYSSISANF